MAYSQNRDSGGVSFYLLNSSGNFATLAAIRHASSLVSNLAAARRGLMFYTLRKHP
jgi:hypothetical protein